MLFGRQASELIGLILLALRNAPDPQFRYTFQTDVSYLTGVAGELLDFPGCSTLGKETRLGQADRLVYDDQVMVEMCIRDISETQHWSDLAMRMRF